MRAVAQIQHFSYGWISPLLAFVLSVFGSLLGLVLTMRARQSTGASRARWFIVAAFALGGTGVWLAHFVALLGFDVPSSVVRYDVRITGLGFLIAVASMYGGLCALGLRQRPRWAHLAVSVPVGFGLAAAQLSAVFALRTGGDVVVDPVRVGLAVAIAVLAAVISLRFSVATPGGVATIGAAGLMAAGTLATHFVAMSAVHIKLSANLMPTEGVGPFAMLTPVCLLACLMITALGYSAVGFSVRQDSVYEQALLARAKDMYSAATITRAHPIPFAGLTFEADGSRGTHPDTGAASRAGSAQAYVLRPRTPANYTASVPGTALVKATATARK
jgi:NO-binding membrane sensor protein with MHYT domain